MESYHHMGGFTANINFAASVENYKHFLYSHFHNLGYQIDVFMATNPHPYYNQLLETYKPVKHTVLDNYEDSQVSRNTKLIAALTCCIDSNIQYDLCLVTRFDLLFLRHLNTNLDLSRFYVMSSLEAPHLICDNVYLFPYKCLKPFRRIIEKNLFKSCHYIKGELDEICPVHFIFDERTDVRYLTSYKIVRNVV